MRHKLIYTVDVDDQVVEQLRDDIRAFLEERGAKVSHSGTAVALPTFIVRGVNVDKRRKEPEPFQVVVQAEDAEAAEAQVSTGTMVVAHVTPGMVGVDESVGDGHA